MTILCAQMAWSTVQNGNPPQTNGSRILWERSEDGRPLRPGLGGVTGGPASLGAVAGLVSAPAAAWVALSAMALSPRIVLRCEEGNITVLSTGRGGGSEEIG